MKNVEILGYSERGIINSLIFSIGDDKDLMNKFIESMNLHQSFQLGNPTDYTVILEQSFSRFGSADLVLIIHYEKPQDKKVLFIEGKVKTSNGNWNIQLQYDKYKKYKEQKEKPKDYWSNLFSQLYLKKLLIENWSEIKQDENFTVKTDNVGTRKIGKNKVVLTAFDLIKCEEKNAFFIGLIPTKKLGFDSFYGVLDFKMNFVLWENVYNFCLAEEKLKKVLEIFKYNKGQIY